MKNISDNGYHHVELRLHLKNSSLSVHGIYRPPDFDMLRFHTFLENIIACADLQKPIFILGDLNVAVNRTSDANSIHYLNLLRSYGMMVTNTCITRPRSSNVLDHVVSRADDADSIRNYTIDCDISDHNYILTFYKSVHQLPQFKTIEEQKVDFPSLNTQFSMFLRSTNFRALEPNERLITISDKYQELKAVNTTTRTFRVKLKQTDCHWFNFTIWKLNKDKQIALRRSKRNPENVDYARLLDEADNLLTAAKRRIKAEYYRNQFATNNAKSLWRNINKVLGRESKNSEITLCIDGSTLENPTETADAFNAYFTTIGSTLADEMQSTGDINHHGTINRISSSIFIRPATSGEVLCIIANLNSNKASGHDGLPTSAIKQHSEDLSTILSEAFNDCIEAGIYPDSLKMAMVYPVHKSGDPKLLSNYRPISVLSSMNKIFEKLLAVRFTQFLDQHNFFYNKQFGFRKGASTELAVLELVDDLSETIDRKKLLAGALFLDLSKAFDTIHHELLLKKLDAFGIRGLANDLVRSYLTNRRQVVCIKGNRSSQLINKAGVPQGSVLGPLFFLVAVNDLGVLRLQGLPRMFADDTVLSYAGKTQESLLSMMSSDLLTINSFLQNNFLSLNARKTKIMIFRGKRTILPPTPTLMFCGEEIETVQSFKYLGILLDENLSWRTHIGKLTENCSALCGILRKLSYFLPQHVLLKIYHAFIHSRYLYGSAIWGSVGANQLRSLQVQQNRSIKAIFRLPFLHPTVELYQLQRHSILPVVALHKYQSGIVMQRILVYKDIHTNFTFNSGQHRHSTRNIDQIVTNAFSTEIGRRRFSSLGPRLYNSLPLAIRNSNSNTVFKQKLKEYLRNEIGSYF